MKKLHLIVSFLLISFIALTCVANTVSSKHLLAVYDHAYTAYLANTDLNNALKTATEAVHYYPDNLKWRERLAKVASWNNRPDITLKQLVFISKKTKDPKLIARSIVLAKDINDFESQQLLYLMQYNNSIDPVNSAIGYATAAEGLGDPEAGINFLKNTLKKHPSPKIHKKLAQLYHDVGNHEYMVATVKSLQSRASKVDRIKNAIRLSHAYSLTNRSKEALTELLKVWHLASKHDTEYWETVSQLAWSLNRNKLSYEAYRMLYSTKKITEHSLQRLSSLAFIYDPKFALESSYFGWNKYHNLAFLDSIFVLAGKFSEWNILDTTISSLTNANKEKLTGNRSYINARARLYLYKKQSYQALRFYINSVKKNKNDAGLKVDFIWFLIENKFTHALKIVLQQWYPLLNKHPQLFPPFIVGFQAIGRPDLAARLYASKWGEIKHNYDWLVHYSYILDFLELQHYGVKIRTYALKSLIAKRKVVPLTDRALYLAYLKLLLANVSGDKTQQSMAVFNKKFLHDQELDDLLMAWDLSLNNYNRAGFVSNFQRPELKTAPWAAQTIALHYNQKYKLQKLLANNVEELPHRDRVIAADRVGSVRVAQQLAYQGLQQHPADSRMYKLYEQTELPAADYFALHTNFRYFDTLYGPQLVLDGKNYLTPRVYLMPKVTGWYLQSRSKKTIVTPSNPVGRANILLGYRYWAGELQLGVGVGHGLAIYPGAIASISYKLTSKLMTKLTLGYQQPVDVTSALILGGMRNLVTLNANYTVTERDYLNGEATQGFYYIQDGHYLGTGQFVQFYYEHKFQLAYPDWHLNLFSNYYRYQPVVSKVGGKAERLSSTKGKVDVNFFLPKNALEYGVSAGYGEHYLEDYTNAWRTFGALGITNNTRFGVGMLINFGVAGSVFGRDHLAFYTNLSRAQTTSDPLNYLIGMLYRVYF